MRDPVSAPVRNDVISYDEEHLIHTGVDSATDFSVNAIFKVFDDNQPTSQMSFHIELF